MKCRMADVSETSLLGKGQRIFLLVFAFILATLLFLLRVNINERNPIDDLARRSLQPEIALSNGRPTVFEFYADWCEACLAMAPDIKQIEASYRNKVDIVLLNVDNTRWQDLIDLYKVNGIPQMNFFNANGDLKGTSVGIQDLNRLEKLVSALVAGEVLPNGRIDGRTSKIINSSEMNSQKTIDFDKGPRSHY